MHRPLTLADLPALRITRRRPRNRSMSRAARLARAPSQPKGIETLYTSVLLSLLREQQRQIRHALDLPDAARADSVSDYFAIAIARLRTQFLDLLTEEHLTGLLERVFRRVNKHSMEETKRLIGIQLEDVPGLGALIDRFRRENVQLIRSVASEQLDRVQAVLEQSQTAGARVEDIAAKVQGEFDVSESRAALIARDQVLKANADVTQARHVAAGITEYVWTTTGDDRVRHDHRKLDGQRFKYSAPPVTDERTGARNPPGRDFQCRCTADPVIDGLL